MTNTGIDPNNVALRERSVQLVYQRNVLKYQLEQLEAERDRTEMGWYKSIMPTWLWGAPKEDVEKNNAYQAKLDVIEEDLEKKLDETEKAFKDEVIRTGHANSLTDVVLPDLIGGRSRFELEQGVDFRPNLWQEYMPTWLGGWSDEKLALTKRAGEMAGYVDRPNWWQKRMPTFLGGWKNEEIARVEGVATSHGLLPSRPNLWERVMPTWLGGASKEEIDRYDNAVAERDKKYPTMSGYKRVMPTWLGGASKEEIQQFDNDKIMNREVLKNVTAADLKQAGFSLEQIDALQMRVDKFRISKYAMEGANNPLGLLNRFHRVSEQMTMTQEDLGLTKEQMLVVSRISQNNANRS